MVNKFNKSRDKIVNYAVRVLPLDKVSTGPAMEMGLGKEYNIHGCLDGILQVLGGYPKHGWLLVDAALSSPVIRNRNFALKVLSQWGKANWRTEIEKKMRNCQSIEPDEKVKTNIKTVLEAKPLI